MSQDNHNSGIRAARKIKQNKAPQRGLGVEKLEKIRMEEQRKNGTGMPLPPPLPPPIQQYQPPPPVPFPAASLSDFTSPPPPMPSSALVNMSNNSKLYGSRVTNPSSSGSLSSLGWSLGSSLGSLDGGGFSSARLSLDSTMKVEADSKPNWPPLGLMQWRQQNQNQFSSFMNPPLSSSSSSSGINFQTEPPSNQSTHHSYNQSSYMHPFGHHDDHKIAGMKRSWPFGLDNLPDSISGNATSFASPFGRSNDSYGKRNPALREGPSVSALNHLNWNLKCSELNPIKRSKENGTLDGEFRNPNKRSKGNGNLDGNFLSLGISANPLYSSTTKYNQPTTTFPFPPPDYHEISNNDMLSFQRSLENQVIHQQQHSLFPSKEQNARHSTSTSSKTELEDGVDLTLRL